MLKELFKRPLAERRPAEGTSRALSEGELFRLYVQEYCLNRHICLKNLILMMERAIIYSALEEAGGNQRAAAEILGVRPNTLHYKIQRMGLVPVHKYVMAEELSGGSAPGADPGKTAPPASRKTH